MVNGAKENSHFQLSKMRSVSGVVRAIDGHVLAWLHLKKESKGK